MPSLQLTVFHNAGATAQGPVLNEELLTISGTAAQSGVVHSERQACVLTSLDLYEGFDQKVQLAPDRQDTLDQFVEIRERREFVLRGADGPVPKPCV